jgi:AbrB family looped-hinge helix DNA binding protein
MPRIHDKYLLLENERLSAKGFRCIPLLKPIPDIIAVKGKDLEIYAVEVIHKSSPQLKNYDKAQWFDDVLFAFYPVEPPDFKANRVKIDGKGRITIPYAIRKKYGLKYESVLEVQDLGNEKLVLAILIK